MSTRSLPRLLQVAFDTEKDAFRVHGIAGGSWDEQLLESLAFREASPDEPPIYWTLLADLRGAACAAIRRVEQVRPSSACTAHPHAPRKRATYIATPD